MQFPHGSPTARNISLVVLLIIIAVIGLLFYQVMVGFFVPLFLAALLVVIFHPLHERITRRLGNRPQLSALLTTISILLIVLLPMALTAVVATMQGAQFVRQLNLNIDNSLVRARASLGLELPYTEEIRRVDDLLLQLLAMDDRNTSLESSIANANATMTAVHELQSVALEHPQAAPAGEKLKELADALEELKVQISEDPIDVPGLLQLRIRINEQWLNARRILFGGPIKAELFELTHPTRNEVATWLKAIQPTLLSLTGATGAAVGRILFGSVIMVISLYFFLVDGPTMLKSLMSLSPLDDRYEQQLLVEFDRICRAVVLATILSAVAQGILASIGYLLVGFSSVMLLMLLTTVMALIPFLGAAAIWAPCAVYLAVVEGRYTAAILLAIYGAGIVSSIDNVIKAFILHGRSRLHPLLALLSVLGGVVVFGPIGILIGPMVVVFMQTSLEILNRELAEGHCLRHASLILVVRFEKRRSIGRYLENGDDLVKPFLYPC